MAKRKGPEPEQDSQEESAPKHTRWSAVHQAIREMDSDTSYNALIERAQELLKASGDVSWDNYDATYKIVDSVVGHLTELGYVEWDVLVHPTKAGKIGNGGAKNGK